MVQLLQDDFDLLADAYAFIGNSLLKPMSMTEAVGLDAAFWEAFPDFEDEGVSVAKEELIEWADTQTDKDSGQAVEDVSVEYTRLFIGPPSPAAAPWETMYDEALLRVKRFVAEHPLKWIGDLKENVAAAFPDGYIVRLLTLATACLKLNA